MKFDANTTRRSVLTYGGAALTALAAGLPAIGPANAQNVSVADLLAKQALEDVFIGKPDAPVTIIEYAALTCSHCGAFHRGTLKELKSRYIETGKVRLALREFPLHALGAAGFMLARCAGPERRTAIVDFIFSKLEEWLSSKKPFEALQGYAKQAGITPEAFEKCLNDKELYKKIETVRNTASSKFGVTSTPTFFVNGTKLSGDLPIADFAKVIDPLLAARK
ncbi:MAG: DsbA family protein [Beijerinckiaceae bacterium]